MSDYDEWSGQSGGRDVDDVNDFLESGGIPSAAFENIGDNWHGQVLRVQKVQGRDFETGEALTWDDGSPKYQINIDIQTDVRNPDIVGDDGTRRIYCRGHMINALRGGLRAASAKLMPGGFIDVTFVNEGTPPKRGAKPPKLYEVKYRPGELPQGLHPDDIA